MKTKLPFFAATLLATAAALAAAPLAATTAVHTKPDDAAPTITVLKAGTEPAAAPDTAAPTPDGWTAVGLPGPFQGYVKNGDLLKNLDVRPGAPIYLEPKEDSGVLATMDAGDKVKITGLLGRWTQISFAKKLTGYIRTGPAPASAGTAASAPAAAPAKPAPGDSSAVPSAAPAVNSTAAGKPAPVVDTGSGMIPRQFEGKLVSTRSPFHPRRPFDWALVDDTGKRIAYLDVSKLLLTEQIDSYVNHTVFIYGTPKAINDGKDLVIAAENLQLK